MSRLNLDNKLKFGKRTLKKKKKRELNLTKQVLIQPEKNFTEASQLLDSDLEEKIMKDQDEDMDDR